VTQDTKQDVLFSAENLDLKQESHTSLVVAVEREVMQHRHPGRYFRQSQIRFRKALRRSHVLM
jgi:hypothetical protein